MSEENKEVKAENDLDSKWNGDLWVFILLILLFGFGGSENPKISELDKKIARLEGQVSMIGGKTE